MASYRFAEQCSVSTALPFVVAGPYYVQPEEYVLYAEPSEMEIEQVPARNHEPTLE